jgi:hypothetical protein
VATSDRGKAVRLRNGRGRYTLSPDTARRRDRAVQLRAEGWTYARIAQEVGYASAASALKAINAALAAIPQASCEELIRQEEAKLNELDSRLAAIAADPPIQHSAIGKPVIDPRSGEPVRNMSVAIAAMKERRMVGESLRRMRGADKPAAPVFDADQLRMVDEISRERARRIAAGTPAAELPRPAWHAEERDGAWQIISDETGEAIG